MGRWESHWEAEPMEGRKEEQEAEYPQVRGEGDERNRRAHGRKRKHRETGAESPEEGGSRKVKAGKG